MFYATHSALQGAIQATSYENLAAHLVQLGFKFYTATREWAIPFQDEVVVLDYK